MSVTLMGMYVPYYIIYKYSGDIAAIKLIYVGQNKETCKTSAYGRLRVSMVHLCRKHIKPVPLLF